MEIALWAGGIAYAALAGIGGLAYRNGERWPAFRRHAGFVLLCIVCWSGGAANGIQFVQHFPGYGLKGWTAAAIVFAASLSAMGMLAVANWLRKP